MGKKLANNVIANRVRKLRRERDLLEAFISEAMEHDDLGAADFMSNDVLRIDKELAAIV